MMKDKENQVPINQYSREPQSAGVQGVEPVLRRKRSVFGGKDKEKEVKPPMPLERKSTYATGAFAAPLDVKFGQNMPGPMEGGNRRPRREYPFLSPLFGCCHLSLPDILSLLPRILALFPILTPLDLDLR
jgi:hypothetical protein